MASRKRRISSPVVCKIFSRTISAQTKDFVARWLRYVDAVRSPIAPVIAGVGAALIAAPIVWLIPIVGVGTAIAFGLSVGMGVAAGNKDVRQSLPPG